MEHEEKGILVDRLVQAETTRYQKHFHEMLFLALKFIYLLIASFGIAGGFLRTFQIPVNQVWTGIGIVLICVLFTVVYSFPGKVPFTLPALMAAAVILGIAFRGLLLQGLGCMFNRMVEQVNAYYDISVPMAAVEALNANGQTVSVLFLMAVFIGILASGMIYYLDARVTALIMTFPLAIALAVGLFPDLLSSALMLFALIGIYFLQYTRQRESFRHQMVSVQLGSGMLSRLRWQTAAAAATVVLLLFPVSHFQLGPVINQGFESQSELREDIRSGNLISGMRDFWKKLMRGEWDWLPFDIIRSSGVHGGKLSNVKEIRDYDDLHLYLDISDDLFAPLYIRGYVGTNYTGQGWKEQTGEQKEAAKLAGMSAGMLGGNYYRLLEELQAQGNPGVYGRLRFVITNREANSAYSYIPYGTDISEFEPSDAYDIYTKEKTDENILNMYYMNTQRLSNLEALEEAGQSRTEDMSYRQYARETYLTVPEEGLDRFYAEYGGMTFDSAADCVAFVRESLAAHAAYTKAPGSTPKGKDYVEYFLYENQKGVCTHFATAAVLMFRTFGIPARYVEGYLTTSLTADGGANEILDRSAHAWAEIYIDGAGWVPIEVTPGFLNEDDMQDDREEESSLSRDDLTDVENSTEEETLPEETTQEEPSAQTQEETAPEQTTRPAVAPETPANPTQPSAPPPSEQNDTDNSSNGLLRTILRTVLIAAAVILLIAFVLLMIRLQYRKRLERLEHRLNGGSPREGILAAFDMLERISCEEGMILDEYADSEKALEQYPFLDEETLAWLRQLGLEAAFSRHSFDEDTRADAVAFYREFVRQILEDGTWVKKWMYRYIRCYG